MPFAVLPFCHLQQGRSIKGEREEVVNWLKTYLNALVSCTYTSGITSKNYIGYYERTLRFSSKLNETLDGRQRLTAHLQEYYTKTISENLFSSTRYKDSGPVGDWDLVIIPVLEKIGNEYEGYLKVETVGGGYTLLEFPATGDLVYEGKAYHPRTSNCKLSR